MPVELDGPHSLQMALFRQGQRRLLHLVNSTGARPLQDTIPPEDIVIRLRLDCSCCRIGALVNQRKLEFEQMENVVKITIPHRETWEIVCFESVKRKT